MTLRRVKDLGMQCPKMENFGLIETGTTVTLQLQSQWAPGVIALQY